MKYFPIVKANAQSFGQRKLVHGVGVNDAEYMVKPLVGGVRYYCPFYKKWADMITRCYDSKIHAKQPSYSDCTVCDEWLLFSNFRGWMSSKTWEGLELDKDVLIKGNRTYSPSACMFVTSEVNTLLNRQESSRGLHPLGVDIHKQTGKFRAQCYLDGVNNYIGLYATSDEAEFSYWKFKSYIIASVAEKQTDKRVRDALISYIPDRLKG